MKQSSTSDVITFKDVVSRIPPMVKKLPHVLRGLGYAFDPRQDHAVGLGWAFEKVSRENPQGTAIVCARGSITYKAMNAWANQIAHYFLSKGLQKGDVVAIMLENRMELLVTAVALAKIGVIAALVNTSQRGKVLAHSLNLVKPMYIVAGEEVQEAIAEIRADLTSRNNPLWVADQDTRNNYGQAPEGFDNFSEITQVFPKFNPNTTKGIRAKDGLFYIYTSGTTGLPKAVVFNNGRWMKGYGTFGHLMNLNQQDVLYATLPLYHATGMVVAWSAVIVGQGTFAIRRKFSTSEFWVDVHKFNVTAFAYVGELCRYLYDAPPSDLDRGHKVRKVVGNGMRPNIWGKFKQRFGIEEFYEFYASSEGNVGFSNIFNFENTVGFSPMPYAIVEYDKEAGVPTRTSSGLMKQVAVGEVGLLMGKITDRSPFDGYSDPEKNKAVIFDNVLEKGDKYFNTGDLVRDIGYRHAQFVDRLGDTFRWKGENVSTGEVENALSDYAKISEAVVYGVEIANTNGRAGMSVIIAHEGSDIEPSDYAAILTYAKDNLPPYAIPVFLRIQHRLETTATFKYQKTTLKTEGFDPSKTEDVILVWLPGTDSYQVVDEAVYKRIQAGEYRF